MSKHLKTSKEDADKILKGSEEKEIKLNDPKAAVPLNQKKRPAPVE